MSLTIEGGAAPALEPAETVTQPVKSENSAPESTVKQENNNSTLAKAGELQFSGAYMAARVDRQQPVPVTTPLSTTGTAAGTQATYQVGPPARPNIRHDNGFLQNPNNPNDPKPMPTRAPTDAERSAYNTQVFKANAGRIAQFVGYLPDGIENYRHFLTGNGADHKFSYDKFVSDDKSGQTVLKNAIGDTQKGAEEIYRQMVAKDPSLANKPVTFQITGSQIGVGSGNRFPYPATENWQKAIGGHSIWNSAQVRCALEPIPECAVCRRRAG